MGSRWPLEMKPASASDRLSTFSSTGTFLSCTTQASQAESTVTSAPRSEWKRSTTRVASALWLGRSGELLVERLDQTRQGASFRERLAASPQPQDLTDNHLAELQLRSQNDRGAQAHAKHSTVFQTENRNLRFEEKQARKAGKKAPRLPSSIGSLDPSSRNRAGRGPPFRHPGRSPTRCDFSCARSRSHTIDVLVGSPVESARPDMGG